MGGRPWEGAPSMNELTAHQLLMQQVQQRAQHLLAVVLPAVEIVSSRRELAQQAEQGVRVHRRRLALRQASNRSGGLYWRMPSSWAAAQALG